MCLLWMAAIGFFVHYCVLLMWAIQLVGVSSFYNQANLFFSLAKTECLIYYFGQCNCEYRHQTVGIMYYIHTLNTWSEYLQILQVLNYFPLVICLFEMPHIIC